MEASFKPQNFSKSSLETVIVLWCAASGLKMKVKSFILIKNCLCQRSLELFCGLAGRPNSQHGVTVTTCGSSVLRLERYVNLNGIENSDNPNEYINFLLYCGRIGYSSNPGFKLIGVEYIDGALKKTWNTMKNAKLILWFIRANQLWIFFILCLVYIQKMHEKYFLLWNWWYMKLFSMSFDRVLICTSFEFWLNSKKKSQHDISDTSCRRPPGVVWLMRIWMEKLFPITL